MDSVKEQGYLGFALLQRIPSTHKKGKKKSKRRERGRIKTKKELKVHSNVGTRWEIGQNENYFQAKGPNPRSQRRVFLQFFISVCASTTKASCRDSIGLKDPILKTFLIVGQSLSLAHGEDFCLRCSSFNLIFFVPYRKNLANLLTKNPLKIVFKSLESKFSLSFSGCIDSTKGKGGDRIWGLDIVRS